MRRAIELYQWAAGLCDGATGLLLVFAPVWTLRLMHVAIAPVPVQFASFIGVFVFAVGATYLWAALRWSPFEEYTAEWTTQWKLTALIRTLVALFLTVEVASGAMEPAWILVAASDAALAGIQWFGLARGWLGRAR